MHKIFLSFLMSLAPSSMELPQPKTESLRFDLPARQSWYTLICAPDKEKAMLTVKSDKEGDVDLFVIDAFGKIVGKDTSVGKDCKVELAPPEKWASFYLVKITNLGPADNCCVFETNMELVGQTGKVTFGKILPKKSWAGYHRSSSFGDIAILGMMPDPKSDDLSLAVYDVEDRKIAFDLKGEFVAWPITRHRITRVVLVNNGKNAVGGELIPRTERPDTKTEPAFDLNHDAKQTFHVRFLAYKLAAIWVTSEKNTDVDLIVYDEKGKEVISDITIGKDCFVGWMNRTEAVYRVVVVNHGVGPNRCVLKHNGELVKKRE